MKFEIPQNEIYFNNSQKICLEIPNSLRQTRNEKPHDVWTRNMYENLCTYKQEPEKCLNYSKEANALTLEPGIIEAA